jgi:4-diphosphocytidyl-2-C-methyl-D-erythritol kinase
MSNLMPVSLSTDREGELRLFSPSKLNLFFRVLRKREDGYHEIASLYQAISLGDRLTIKISEQDSLTCSDLSLETDANLIVKARGLFRQKTGVYQPFFMSLDKKIPIQSGLGGGSGNAATALWGMNQLCGSPATLEDLKIWSCELGSDVPFFFSSGTAFCQGKGEIFQSFDLPTKLNCWIAKPTEGLSTPAVYGQHRCVESDKNISDVLKSFSLNAPDYFNDLETSAFTLLPKLVTIKQQLIEAGFDHVVMTGSGTAFFCLGSIAPPIIEGIQFYKAISIQRPEGSWYAS